MRIVIAGNGGAGKSTLARRLGQRTGLPVFHLDALYWQPGWVEPSQQEWRVTQGDALAGSHWIADGNYGGTMDERPPLADLVVLLDYPPITCLRGVITRRWRFRRQLRPDMALGCPERLTAAFFKYVWHYRRDHLPRLLAKVAAHNKTNALLRLRSRRDAETWLSGFEVTPSSP